MGIVSPWLELQKEHYLPGAIGGAAVGYARPRVREITHPALGRSAQGPKQVVFCCRLPG
jgi:hypothetical protein